MTTLTNEDVQILTIKLERLKNALSSYTYYELLNELQTIRYLTLDSIDEQLKNKNGELQ